MVKNHLPKEGILQDQFSIRVYKEYFNFACAHFMIFEDGTREPLHGHNYKVRLEVEAPVLTNDMVFDFLDIKPVVRACCDQLDHKLLIPADHPNLRIDRQKHNYLITTPDESEFSIPQKDVLLLPILNTSVERIASHLVREIHKTLFEKYNQSFERYSIEVEETTGQCARVNYIPEKV